MTEERFCKPGAERFHIMAKEVHHHVYCGSCTQHWIHVAVLTPNRLTCPVCGFRAKLLERNVNVIR